MVRTINDYGLETEVLERKGYVVVAFLMRTSMPCDHFRPEFDGVAEKLEEKATFFKIDAEENPTVTKMYDVEAVPTTVVFLDSEEIKRWEGPYSRETLVDRLTEVMAKGAK